MGLECLIITDKQKVLAGIHLDLQKKSNNDVRLRTTYVLMTVKHSNGELYENEIIKRNYKDTISNQLFVYY